MGQGFGNKNGKGVEIFLPLTLSIKETAEEAFGGLPAGWWAKEWVLSAVWAG